MLILLFLLGFSTALFAQAEPQPGSYFETQYLYGTFLRHNKNVAHLVRVHPQAVLLGYNSPTLGKNSWERKLNYPDLGVSFIYQDFRNSVVGRNFGLYAHINFYFLRRHLVFKLGQGFAYNTNPFDLEQNVKNVAYGTHLLSSTYFIVSYMEQDLFENVGFQLGLSLLHHSNGNFKSPNSGTNVFGLNAGVQYRLDTQRKVERDSVASEKPFDKHVHFNLALMGGLNTGDYINLGQFPFFVVSGYAEKPLGEISSVNLGAEMFFSYFLKEEINYVSSSFPGRNVDGDTDFKRIGLFAGHDLILAKFRMMVQAGYYVYYPYEFEDRIYFRFGIKYFVSENWFLSSALKAHGAQAEAIEWGIGYRI